MIKVVILETWYLISNWKEEEACRKGISGRKQGLMDHKLRYLHKSFSYSHESWDLFPPDIMSNLSNLISQICTIRTRERTRRKKIDKKPCSWSSWELAPAPPTPRDFVSLLFFLSPVLQVEACLMPIPLVTIIIVSSDTSKYSKSVRKSWITLLNFISIAHW